MIIVTGNVSDFNRLVVVGNRIEHIVAQWLPLKDQQQWVLGVVVAIKGSSYRKVGAMMLFGEMGQQWGLLSGGCLEADLLRHARMVMDSQAAKSVTYDMTDEDDIGWQLGIGCGGMVKVMLMPINASNNYLRLPELASTLNKGQRAFYWLNIDNICENQLITCADQVSELNANAANWLLLSGEASTPYVVEGDDNGLLLPLKPAPHMAIFGGGVDAIPLMTLAKNIGWRVTIVDSRPAYGHPNHFHQADEIIKLTASELASHRILSSIDAAVIMHHNLNLDADVLTAVQRSSAQYIALLGPKHRRDKIVSMMTIKALSKPLSSPAGFDLGGDIPEAIALSILAECHAVLEGKHKLSK